MKNNNNESLDSYQLALLHQNLCKYLFHLRDFFTNSCQFELEYTKSNGLLKFFAKNTFTNQQRTLFCALGNVNIIRIAEIVHGCLLSCGLQSSTKLNINEEFSENLSFFIQKSANLTISLDGNTISARTSENYHAIIELDNMDRASQEYFLRSLCVLIAACGKNVSNNVDELIVNEYGIINKADITENEDTQNTPLL